MQIPRGITELRKEPGSSNAYLSVPKLSAQQTACSVQKTPLAELVLFSVEKIHSVSGSSALHNDKKWLQEKLQRLTKSLLSIGNIKDIKNDFKRLQLETGNLLIQKVCGKQTINILQHEHRNLSKKLLDLKEEVSRDNQGTAKTEIKLIDEDKTLQSNLNSIIDAKDMCNRKFDNLHRQKAKLSSNIVQEEREKFRIEKVEREIKNFLSRLNVKRPTVDIIQQKSHTIQILQHNIKYLADVYIENQWGLNFLREVQAINKNNSHNFVEKIQKEELRLKPMFQQILHETSSPSEQIQKVEKRRKVDESLLLNLEATNAETINAAESNHEQHRAQKTNFLKVYGASFEQKIQLLEEPQLEEDV